MIISIVGIVIEKYNAAMLPMFLITYKVYGAVPLIYIPAILIKRRIINCRSNNKAGKKSP